MDFDTCWKYNTIYNGIKIVVPRAKLWKSFSKLFSNFSKLFQTLRKFPNFLEKKLKKNGSLSVNRAEIKGARSGNAARLTHCSNAQSWGLHLVQGYKGSRDPTDGTFTAKRVRDLGLTRHRVLAGPGSEPAPPSPSESDGPAPPWPTPSESCSCIRDCARDIAAPAAVSRRAYARQERTRVRLTGRKVPLTMGRSDGRPT